MLPTLTTISDVLKDIQTKHTTRMDRLEDRMDNLESSDKAIIEEKISSLKNEVIDSLKEDIDRQVDIRFREMEDRRRRDLNIVIFNLKEHVYPVGTDNKRADENDFIRISENLGLEDVKFVTTYRLGRRKSNVTRPLKVIMVEKSQRKFLVENAKQIPVKLPAHQHDVVITRDMTLLQRKERKEKFLRRKADGNTRSEAGETASASGGRRDPGSPMELDRRPPSSSSSSEDLSQVNPFGDTSVNESLLRGSQPRETGSPIHQDDNASVHGQGMFRAEPAQATNDGNDVGGLPNLPGNLCNK